MFHVLERVGTADSLDQFVMRFGDLDKEKCLAYARSTGEMCYIITVDIGIRPGARDFPDRIPEAFRRMNSAMGGER